MWGANAHSTAVWCAKQRLVPLTLSPWPYELDKNCVDQLAAAAPPEYLQRSEVLSGVTQETWELSELAYP